MSAGLLLDRKSSIPACSVTQVERQWNSATNLLRPKSKINPPYHRQLILTHSMTLIFTDPDIYDSPELTNRECQHWLVVNIPGCEVTNGEVLSGYIGSGPPEGAGVHRYIYILFKQPKKLSFEEKKLNNKSINGRAPFSTKKFAEKYNLGSPVAGNFYRAQFDDYVPQLNKSS